ncbi:MAG: hypothetical protein K5745_00445 [Saccharofermentans sp.]|nr:hypothetical protein [Saccharofermentans sp.]
MPGKIKKLFRFPDVILIPFIICAFLVAYGIVHMPMRTRNNPSVVSRSEVKAGTDDYKYEIEEDRDFENYRMLKGYFVIPGRTYRFYNFGLGKTIDGVYNKMYLAVTDGGEVVLLPTVVYYRSDVSREINDGTDYYFCGFEAHIPAEYKQLAQDQLYMVYMDPYDNMELYEIDVDNEVS